MNDNIHPIDEVLRDVAEQQHQEQFQQALDNGVIDLTDGANPKLKRDELLASLDGLTSEHDRRIDTAVDELFGEEEDDELDRIRPALAPAIQDEQQTVEPAEPAEPTVEPTVPDGHDPQLRGGATMDNYPAIPAIDDSIVYASCELAEAAVHAHSLKAGYEVIRPNGGKVNGVGQTRLIPFKCANFKAPLVRKDARDCLVYSMSCRCSVAGHGRKGSSKDCD
jgi:hypothetical protein